jgi:hypothetical protein
MKAPAIAPYSVTLPLPAFVLHPLTALGLAVLHAYLALGHLSKLSLGTMRWTDIWKGFGALAAAYVFTALASRGVARMQKAAVRTL